MKKSKDFFRKGNYYLIHNYSNGGEKLFKHVENYYYFLRKYEEYMNEHWELIAWNLLPDCYTFMIKVRNDYDESLSVDEINRMIYTDFGDFTRGYAKAMNKAFHRKGSLFAKRFSRKVVLDNFNVRRLICDIHFEPVIRGLTEEPEKWKYSSYKNIFLDKQDPRFCQVVAPFETLANFLAKHKLTNDLRKAA